MLRPKLSSYTQSAGTKLTVEQHAAIKAQADAQGIELSEFIRKTLLSTPVDAETPNPVEVLLRETLALRIILLNLAGVQASGEPLTAERLQAVRAYADEHKAARARMLLTATANYQPELAESSESKEAA